MSRRCIAKTCFNTPASRPTLKFFCFPKDEETCRIWAENCGRPDLLELPLEKLSKVKLCADHFETKWFLNPKFKTAFIRTAQPIPTIFHNNLIDFIPESLKRTYVSNEGLKFPSIASDKSAEIKTEQTDNLTSEEVVLGQQQCESEESVSSRCHRMCRLCACLVQDKKLIEIFSIQQIDIFRKINRLMSNKVLKGDGLPEFICELCIKKLNYCDETLSSFLAADRKLRDLFVFKTARQKRTLVTRIAGMGLDQNKNDKCDEITLSSAGDSSLVIKEGTEENEHLPGVGSCKKVYMIRKKPTHEEYELPHIDENVFDGGEFEFLTKDELGCEGFKECSSPNAENSESFMNGDLVQLVNVDLQQDGFLVNSNSNGEDLCSVVAVPGFETKLYQCSKCNVNFSDKVKLLFHEISVHVGEASVKIDNSIEIGLECEKNVINEEKEIVCKKYKRERVSCKKCGQEFIGQRPLKRHLLGCHDPKDNVCLYCNASFPIKSQLISHLRFHTNEKPYFCVLCDAKFHFKKELCRHKHLHVKSQEIACTICNKVFNSRHSLWRHKRIHSQSRCVLCYLCGKVLSNTQSLNVHLRTHSSERPFTCDSCNKKFKDTVSLSKHMNMHSAEKKFKCDVCNRAFYSKALVKQHKLSHSGVKPYKCEVCGSCFNRQGNLNQHKKRHSRRELSNQSKLVPLFECTVCGKQMQSELTLKYHIAKHTGEKKPFDCETCGKRFIAIEPFRVHMRIHTGERPYVCVVCNKSFRSPYTLKQHAGLHCDEFPYPCPFCERRFKRLQSLIVHKRTHTGEKPHVCPICSRCFAQKGDMLKHTKTHSRDSLSSTNKDQGDELVLEMDHIPDFALSDAEITNEFLINMPIVEVQTEIQ